MKAAIMSLNRNKATDFYGIKAENIIYGGKMLHLFLQKLLDKIFETQLSLYRTLHLCDLLCFYTLEIIFQF
jgi:hypothetical protein